MGVARFALRKDGALSAATTVLVAVFVLALNWWWLYMIWRRVNWVRWVTVVLGGLSFLIAPYYYAVRDPLYWAQLSLTLAAVVLLVAPPTQSWYSHGLDA